MEKPKLRRKLIGGVEVTGAWFRGGDSQGLPWLFATTTAIAGANLSNSFDDPADALAARSARAAGFTRGIWSATNKDLGPYAEQAPMRFTSDGNTVINPDGENPYEPAQPPTLDLAVQVAQLRGRVDMLETLMQLQGQPVPKVVTGATIVTYHEEQVGDTPAVTEPTIPRNWKRGTKETALRDGGGDFWGYYRIDANQEWSELDYWDDKEFQPDEQHVYLVPDLHLDVVRDGWLPCEWKDAQGMGMWDIDGGRCKAHVFDNADPVVGGEGNGRKGIFLRIDPNRKAGAPVPQDEFTKGDET